MVKVLNLTFTLNINDDLVDVNYKHQTLDHDLVVKDNKVENLVIEIFDVMKA